MWWLILPKWAATNFLLIRESQNMLNIKRAFTDRRSGKDRRRAFSIRRFRYSGPERRKFQQDRRHSIERREGWVRIDRWSSVKLQDLKLAKYLQPPHKKVTDLPETHPD
jgi:hypothetical protein